MRGGANLAHGGGLHQRLLANGQANFAIVVQRVVVSDGEFALWGHEHALEGFAPFHACRDADDGGLDLYRCLVQFAHPTCGDVDLGSGSAGGAAKFLDQATYLDVVANVDAGYCRR